MLVNVKRVTVFNLKNMIVLKTMKGMNPMHDINETNPCEYYVYPPQENATCWCQSSGQYTPQEKANSQYIPLRDYGPEPFVINIEDATKLNNNFRLALWTGYHLQLTLMSINVGEDIGLEIHPNLDQFLRIEQGQGLVMMGRDRNNLDFERYVTDDYAIIIPAGTWHNLINIGNVPLKLYSIYAPPQHPYGTVQPVKPMEDHDH